MLNCQIVLVGPTGSGKTKTIQHLFGHNGDLKELETSSKSSQTRETVEVILRTRPTDGDDGNFWHWVDVALVDTPGLVS